MPAIGNRRLSNVGAGLQQSCANKLAEVDALDDPADEDGSLSRAVPVERDSGSVT